MENSAKPQWARNLPGSLLDKWPRTGDGELDEPAFLRHCMALNMDDELIAGMLDAYGIPSVRQYPNDGQFGKLIMGMSGTGVNIYVPKTMFEDALTLCEGVPDDENV